MFLTKEEVLKIIDQNLIKIEDELKKQNFSCNVHKEEDNIYIEVHTKKERKYLHRISLYWKNKLVLLQQNLYETHQTFPLLTFEEIQGDQIYNHFFEHFYKRK